MIRIRLVFDEDKWRFVARCVAQLYLAGMFPSRKEAEDFLLGMVKDCYVFRLSE